MTDLKLELQSKLQAARTALVDSIDGLGEYDRRRPMTPSGTSLLGLVKHLAAIEYGYLGACFGRPPRESLPWLEEGAYDGSDMWATADEPSEEIVALYRRACAHADQTIARLDLDAPGSVSWWATDRRTTTLGVLLVRMVDETARHAGHADILRELIDGRGGRDHDSFGDAHVWDAYVGRIQAAADAFRS